MSKVSSAHKVENMDKQLLQQLQDILKFCEEKGHRPEVDSEQNTTLENIKHLIYIRGRKGISVPDNILSLLAKIKNYPTAVKQKRKDLAFQKATEKTNQQLSFKQRCEQIQELTPYDLEIFKFICGEETFANFMNIDIDPFITKIFLDFTYKLYFKRCDSRTRHIINLYTGIYENSKYIVDSEPTDGWLEKSYIEDFKNYYVKYRPLLDKFDNNRKLNRKEFDSLFSLLRRPLCLTYEQFVKFMGTDPNLRDKNKLDLYKTFKDKFEKDTVTKQQIIEKYKSKQPLTKLEIGDIFHLHQETIAEIMRKGRDKIRNDTDWKTLLDSYLKVDADDFMYWLPEEEAILYKYQKDMKIQDIPTNALNKAGKTLMAFFRKGNTKD